MEIEKSGENKIIKGALMLTLSMLIVKLFGLIYKVPLSYILSDEGMGYFNSAYAVYTFFYVISTSGLPKAISILTASNDTSMANRISFTAFKAFFLIGAVLSCIFILLSMPIANALGSRGAHLSMLGIAPSIAFVAASGALRGYFSGKLKLLPVATSEIISAVSKLIFGLIFAIIGQRLGFEIYEIAAFSITGITLGSFFGFLYLYIILKVEKGEKTEKAPKSLREDFRILKTILKISIPLSLSAAIGSLVNLLDVGLVMRSLRENGFSELQANVIYGNYTTLAVPMFNLVATLLAPISAVLLPILTKSTSESDNIEFEKKTKFSLDIALIITIPVAFLFFGFSESILSIVFEDESAKMAAPLLSSLSFSTVFMGMLLVINTAIEGIGNYRLPLISITLGSIIKLFISAVLIPNDNFNILAAPIGTAASYLFSFLISYFYLKRVKKIKIPIFKTTVFSVAFSSVALSLSMLFDRQTELQNWYFKQFLIYGIFALVYIILIFIVIFWGKSRKKVYNCDKKCSRKLYI